MTVAAVVAVPAAPLLLPAASPAQPADVAAGVGALRDAAKAALGALPPRTDVAVLVAAGDALGVEVAPAASLAGYGLAQVRTDLRADHDLGRALSGATGAATVDVGWLDADLAVLALQVAAARPDLDTVALTVPGAADGKELRQTADQVAATLASARRQVAVVAAGDLSATRSQASPGYLAAGATEWDAAVVDAVRAGDLDALARLGPAEAARVVARGWAPLVTLLAVATHVGVEPRHVAGFAPRGVGHLVAH